MASAVDTRDQDSGDRASDAAGTAVRATVKDSSPLVDITRAVSLVSCVSPLGIQTPAPGSSLSRFQLVRMP